AVDPKLPTTLNGTINLLSDGDPSASGGAIVAIRAARFESIRPVTSTNADTSQMITDEMINEVGGKGLEAQQIRSAMVDGRETKFLVYGTPVPTNFGH